MPFWWWSGEALDVDRLLWQLHELHAKGVSGVQVNYSHTDTPGWPTDVSEPAIFSDAWWGIYSQVSEECGKHGMGIGLSTYTLDWPWGGENLFGELFYSKPELNAREIHVVARRQVPEGETMKHDVSERAIAIRAYPYTEGKLQHGGIDLSAAIVDGQLSWTAPQGDWEVWEFEDVSEAPEQVYAHYCERGEMENKIKEQMMLFSDRTSASNWWANQWRVLLSSLAYVLMDTIRRIGLAGIKLERATVHSIRIKLVKIACLIERKRSRWLFRLSVACPDQQAFAACAAKLHPT